MLLLLLFLLLSAGGSGGVLIDFRSPATPSAKICSALAETARSNRFSHFHLMRYVGEAKAVCKSVAKNTTEP